MADLTEHNLPDGWEITTLDDTCEIIMGQSPPSSTYNDNGIGLPFFQGKSEFGDMYPTVVKWCSEPNKIAEAEDVLISVRAPVGPTNLARERSAIGRGLAALHPELAMPSRFFLYQLRHLEEEIANKGTGTTFAAISKAILEAQQIVLAPFNEQHRIVDEIEAQFSRLDTWLEVMQKLREQLPRLRASILKAAVEGRLIEQDPDDEPAEILLQRILDERRRKWEADYLADLEAKGKPAPKNDKWKEQYPEPEAPDIAGLPELPEGWVWASLGQCSWHSGYGTSQRSDYDASGAPVLRIPNVVNGRIDFTDLKFATDSSGFDEAQALQINDLLIIRTNGSKALLGRSALVLEEFTSPHYYASYLIRYRLLSTNHTPQWIAVVWNSHFVRDWIDQIASTSAGQYNINIANLNKTPIPLPPPNQQVLIIEDVESRFSVIDRLLENIDVNMKRAERMRQSVLKKAFQGRLVEQDPNDEPASELLERIQEERQRRAEEERQKPRQQRERKVKTPPEEQSLVDILADAGGTLSAYALFKSSRYEHSSIEDFYEELREAINGKKIEEMRDSDEAFLRVLNNEN